MKKINVIIITLIIAIMVSAMPCYAKSKVKTVKRYATIVGKWYNEDSDSCSMKIRLNKNGRTYMIYDFVCPLNATCVVYFQKGKIVKIAAVTKVKKYKRTETLPDLQVITYPAERVGGH